MVFTNKGFKEGAIFATLIILLWGLMLCFVGYQYSREKEYKVGLLNARLQQLNLQIADELNIIGSPEELYVRNEGRYDGLRITLIGLDGSVSYDSDSPDGLNRNLATCPEVIEALDRGAGFAINGNAQRSLDDEFFYSATRIDSMIIRSSLPYSISLVEVLKADNIFLFVAVLISLMLSWLGYMSIKLFGRLKQAAIDIDHEHRRYVREQQESVRIKRQLTNNINHELKTPICSILGYLDMVLNNESLGQDMCKGFVKKSYDQAERLRRLMVDLSTITRIDEASNMIERELLSLDTLIAGVVEDVYPQAEQQRVVIENLVDGEVAIMGNQSLLYSIFRNLVDNAIAYSGARKVWVELVAREGDRFRFAIRDNGIGIDAEHLPYIFERFYRVDSGRSRKMGGTGLGLSIVKNAVLFHGGTIEAKASERNGIEFHFTLLKGF
ncbi:MAG: ATP-binding protein [Rikenellaceae bacterium]